jgi:hypothetical protein
MASYSTFAAFAPAILPKTYMSAIALPPTRLPAWMPPVTSPAAYNPGIKTKGTVLFVFCFFISFGELIQSKK